MNLNLPYPLLPTSSRSPSKKQLNKNVSTTIYVAFDTYILVPRQYANLLDYLKTFYTPTMPIDKENWKVSKSLHFL